MALIAAIFLLGLLTILVGVAVFRFPKETLKTVGGCLVVFIIGLVAMVALFFLIALIL